MATKGILLLLLCLQYDVIRGATPCCSSQKWMGHLMEKIGEYNSKTNQASLADVSTFIYYDYVTKELATLHNVKNLTSGSESSLKRIVNYNKKLEWRIIGEECTRVQIEDVMTPPCLWNDSTSFGKHSIPGSSVDVFYKQYDNGGNVRATVEHTTCLLISDASLSSGPDYRLSFGIYENITGGFVPAQAFKVPSYCPTSSSIAFQKPRDKSVWPWKYVNN